MFSAFLVSFLLQWTFLINRKKWIWRYYIAFLKDSILLSSGGFSSLVLGLPERNPERIGSEYKIGESNSFSSGWLCNIQNVCHSRAVNSESSGNVQMKVDPERNTWVFVQYRLGESRCFLDHRMPTSIRHSSVQFSRSVVSSSLRPHGLQHTRLSCPSPTPRGCSDSCPLSQWCHPTISSSVAPYSSHISSQCLLI